MEEEPEEQIPDEVLEQSAPPPASASREKPGWRKTKDGRWAICGPQDIMKPGAEIEVFRKDGSSAKHILSSDPEDIGKPFENYDDSSLMMVCAYKFEEVK